MVSSGCTVSTCRRICHTPAKQLGWAKRCATMLLTLWRNLGKGCQYNGPHPQGLVQGAEGDGLGGVPRECVQEGS